MISFEKYNLTEDQSLPAELIFGKCILYYSFQLSSISIAYLFIFFFENVFGSKPNI